MSKTNLGLVEVMGMQDHRAMDLWQTSTALFTFTCKLATIPSKLKRIYIFISV